MNFKNVKLLGLGALVSISGFAQAQSNDSLNARLDELDQKIRVVERLNEIAAEDAKAAAAKAPKILAGEGGLGVSSADGAYVLKVRGFVQPQAVYLLGNSGTVAVPATSPVRTQSTAGVDNFSIKRLQSDILGSVGKQLDYRLHVNFAAGTADVQDAYLDWKIKPEFAFRVGKFKPPTGLERLFSYSRAPFVEASFVPALQPNRDIGIQVFGDYEKGLVEYQLGYFAGARDGQNNTTDNNDEKDIYGRLFSHPFSKTGNEWLTGFGVGISASVGTHYEYNTSSTVSVVTATSATANTPSTSAAPTAVPNPAASPNTLTSYSTGRQGFFSYNAGDTAGKTTRYSPQAYYYAGPLGVIAEYSVTTQNVRRLVTVGTTPTVIDNDLTNKAWAVTASYFLTGDKNAYKSIKIKKANTFPSFESIGAVEILGRATGIKIDDKAFAPLGANLTQTYANASTQASEALGLGLALKWYLNNSVNIFVGYEQTKFTGGTGTAAAAAVAPVIVDRDVEKVVTTAFNVSF
jgi:phosphate-selective porin OprO/OprP